MSVLYGLSQTVLVESVRFNKGVHAFDYNFRITEVSGIDTDSRHFNHHTVCVCVCVDMIADRMISGLQLYQYFTQLTVILNRVVIMYKGY